MGAFSLGLGELVLHIELVPLEFATLTHRISTLAGPRLQPFFP